MTKIRYKFSITTKKPYCKGKMVNEINALSVCSTNKAIISNFVNQYFITL